MFMNNNPNISVIPTTNIPDKFNVLCDEYITSNIGSPYPNDKNRKEVLRTLAHLVPTYYQTSNNSLDLRSACTLPKHMIPVYKDLNSTCYRSHNFGTVDLSKGTETTKDIQEGCVLSFKNDDNSYNKTYNTLIGVQNQLSALGATLNYDVLTYIEKLRTDIGNFTAILNNMRTIELPNMSAQANAAEIAYNNRKDDCSNILN